MHREHQLQTLPCNAVCARKSSTASNSSHYTRKPQSRGFAGRHVSLQLTFAPMLPSLCILKRGTSDFTSPGMAEKLLGLAIACFQLLPRCRLYKRLGGPLGPLLVTVGPFCSDSLMLISSSADLRLAALVPPARWSTKPRRAWRSNFRVGPPSFRLLGISFARRHASRSEGALATSQDHARLLTLWL